MPPLKESKHESSPIRAHSRTELHFPRCPTPRKPRRRAACWGNGACTHTAPKPCKKARPVTVKKVLCPVKVRGVQTPVTVRRILHSVSVRSIRQPVDVNRIFQPVPIRPLHRNVDNITIYGSNSSVPVQTDALGRIVFSGQVQISPVLYTEKSTLGLQSQDQLQSLPAQDISVQTNLSYAIVNKSDNQVIICLEISPNDRDYTVDSEIVVAGFATQAMTPLRFLRYVRISYRSFETGHSATFDIYYQAQSG